MQDLWIEIIRNVSFAKCGYSWSQGYATEKSMCAILAIQSAGVERGRNGFRKNKSMEKQPESEEDLLEHHTDGTDAFDTLYIGAEKFPQHDTYPVALGGIM